MKIKKFPLIAAMVFIVFMAAVSAGYLYATNTWELRSSVHYLSGVSSERSGGTDFVVLTLDNRTERFMERTDELYNWSALLDRTVTVYYYENPTGIKVLSDVVAN